MLRTWSRVTYALLLISLLFVAACSGPGNNAGGSSNNPGVLDPNKKYTVNFWEAFATGANKTALEDLTKQYMQTHSNVKVNLQAFDSYDTLKTKLTASIASNTPPAIAQIYENWATQYQQNDAIVSLQPFISGKNGLSQSDMSDFYPALLKDGQINGTQYMMPFNKSDLVIYYNASVLEKEGISPPATMQDFVADLAKVTKPDGSRWGLSYTPDVDGWSVLYKALGGGDFVAANGKAVAFADTKNKPYSLQALSSLLPLAKSGAIHVTKSFDWQNDFISQKSVFAISTIASYAFLAQPIGSTFKLAEAPIPSGPAGQFTVLFGTNLSIFSGVDADTQSAAWDYMKFLTSTQANASFVKGTGYMPIRQSTFNGADLQSYYAQAPARKIGPESLKFAFVASTLPAWDQCRNDITTNFTSTLTSQITPDSALDKMAQACNSALAQG
ncbi:MAG: ABC transporter substrate-binding protein [Ktedonobacteraceae bacterium]|nr:ABC transporter substrate-binding protein [Ktedonobacteraceae bacterium]